MVGCPPVQQPLECGHVVGYLDENGDVIRAIRNKPLQLGIDP
jgi:hypothetical protein